MAGGGARTHPRYMKLNQKSSMREERMSQPWMNWTETGVTQRPLAAGGPPLQDLETWSLQDTPGGGQAVPPVL